MIRKGTSVPGAPASAVDIFDGTLLPGDTITITYGDRSGGSAGTRAQTFVEKAFRFRTLIDAQGSGQYVTLPSSPITEIVAGDAERLVLIVPSEAEIERPFDLVVKAEDGWGNPATSYSGAIALEEESGSIANLPNCYAFQPGDRGVRRFGNCTVNRLGIFTIRARALDGTFAGESNPLRALEAPEPRIVPSGPTCTAKAARRLAPTACATTLLSPAKPALWNVSGHQANDFQITAPVWEEIKAAANDANEPGHFVAFVGYEWSGTTAGGGDRNVYFLGSEGELLRSSHAQISDLSDLAGDRYPVSELHEELGGTYRPLFHSSRWRPPQRPGIPQRDAGAFGRSVLLLGRVRVECCASPSHAVTMSGWWQGVMVTKGRPGSSYPGASTFGV